MQHLIPANSINNHNHYQIEESSPSILVRVARVFFFAMMAGSLSLFVLSHMGTVPFLASGMVFFFNTTLFIVLLAGSHKKTAKLIEAHPPIDLPKISLPIDEPKDKDDSKKSLTSVGPDSKEIPIQPQQDKVEYNGSKQPVSIAQVEEEPLEQETVDEVTQVEPAPQMVTIQETNPETLAHNETPFQTEIQESEDLPSINLKAHEFARVIIDELIDRMPVRKVTPADPEVTIKTLSLVKKEESPVPSPGVSSQGSPARTLSPDAQTGWFEQLMGPIVATVAKVAEGLNPHAFNGTPKQRRAHYHMLIPLIDKVLYDLFQVKEESRSVHERVASLQFFIQKSPYFKFLSAAEKTSLEEAVTSAFDALIRLPIEENNVGDLRKQFYDALEKAFEDKEFKAQLNAYSNLSKAKIETNSLLTLKKKIKNIHALSRYIKNHILCVLQSFEGTDWDFLSNELRGEIGASAKMLHIIFWQALQKPQTDESYKSFLSQFLARLDFYLNSNVNVSKKFELAVKEKDITFKQYQNIYLPAKLSKEVTDIVQELRQLRNLIQESTHLASFQEGPYHLVKSENYPTLSLSCKTTEELFGLGDNLYDILQSSVVDVEVQKQSKLMRAECSKLLQEKFPALAILASFGLGNLTENYLFSYADDVFFTFFPEDSRQIPRDKKLSRLIEEDRQLFHKLEKSEKGGFRNQLAAKLTETFGISIPSQASASAGSSLWTVGYTAEREKLSVGRIRFGESSESRRLQDLFQSSAQIYQKTVFRFVYKLQAKNFTGASSGQFKLFIVKSFTESDSKVDVNEIASILQHIHESYFGKRPTLSDAEKEIFEVIAYLYFEDYFSIASQTDYFASEIDFAHDLSFMIGALAYYRHLIMQGKEQSASELSIFRNLALLNTLLLQETNEEEATKAFALFQNVLSFLENMSSKEKNGVRSFALHVMGKSWKLESTRIKWQPNQTLLKLPSEATSHKEYQELIDKQGMIYQPFQGYVEDFFATNTSDLDHQFAIDVPRTMYLYNGQNVPLAAFESELGKILDDPARITHIVELEKKSKDHFAFWKQLAVLVRDEDLFLKIKACYLECKKEALTTLYASLPKNREWNTLHLANQAVIHSIAKLLMTRFGNSQLDLMVVQRQVSPKDPSSNTCIDLVRFEDKLFLDCYQRMEIIGQKSLFVLAKLRMDLFTGDALLTTEKVVDICPTDFTFSFTESLGTVTIKKNDTSVDFHLMKV